MKPDDPAASEGDVNRSPLRQAWRDGLGEAASAALD